MCRLTIDRPSKYQVTKVKFLTNLLFAIVRLDMSSAGKCEQIDVVMRRVSR